MVGLKTPFGDEESDLMYVSRMGWEAFVLMKHPTYVVPTCEFLSPFEFDVDEGMLNFRLGN